MKKKKKKRQGKEGRGEKNNKDWDLTTNEEEQHVQQRQLLLSGINKTKLPISCLFLVFEASEHHDD